MPKSTIAMCLIEYNSQTQDIEFRVISSDAGCIQTYGTQHAPRDTISSACKNYWDFVNDAVKAGEVTGDDHTRRKFHDSLKVRGSALANTLMNNRTKQGLWRLAANSEVLVLITRLLNVPWEALYSSTPDGSGSFLSENCIVTRWPENTADNTRHGDLANSKFDRERIVCIDSVLNEDKAAALETLSKTFESDGEVVYLTCLKSELQAKVSNVRVVHWICEHAPDGLRLDKDVFYCSDDAEVHRFPRGGVLVLTSCQASATPDGNKSVAGEISLSSNCTVIAPSSLIATRAGVEFARRINTQLRQNPDILTVFDLWKKIRAKPSSPAPAAITAESCFSLWYGIYGDVQAMMREGERSATNAS